MSLNVRDLSHFYAIARAYLTLVDATTITMGDGGYAGLTRDQLAVLINRAYREQPGLGTPTEFAES